MDNDRLIYTNEEQSPDTKRASKMIREIKPHQHELDALSNLDSKQPNVDLENQLNENVSSPDYQRNFSNLNKNRNKILWTELGN